MDKGVYVRALTVTAMIVGSAGHRALASGELSFGLPEGVEPPVVHPDDLAEQYWNLLARRDQVERIHPPVEAASTAGS